LAGEAAMSKEGHIRQQSQETGTRRESQRHELDPVALSPVPEALQRLSGPGRAAPGQILALQRTLGNQAVQRMLVQRQEPGGGGGDSARIANLETRTTALEGFRDKQIPWTVKATGYINDNKHAAEANTADLDKAKPWVTKATERINDHSHRIANLESGGS
jgi:hypothetical protein